MHTAVWRALFTPAGDGSALSYRRTIETSDRFITPSGKPPSSPETSMVSVLPLNHAREISLSLHPSTKGLLRPLTHKQDVENPLSTCTAPWMNVRRSIGF